MSSSDTILGNLGLTDKSAARGCGCGGCGCGANAAGDTAADAGMSDAPSATADAVSTDYLVDGMTCGHCVASVTEEVSAIDGVDEVTVDLNAGGTSIVTVVSSVPVSDQAVREAVTEAGYSLAEA